MSRDCGDQGPGSPWSTDLTVGMAGGGPSPQDNSCWGGCPGSSGSSTPGTLRAGEGCWSQVPGLLQGTYVQSLLPSVRKVTYAHTQGAGQHELGRLVGPTGLTGPQVVGWVFSFFPRCPHSACWGSANTCIPGVHQGWGSKWDIELTLKTDRGPERNFTPAT